MAAVMVPSLSWRWGNRRSDVLPRTSDHRPAHGQASPLGGEGPADGERSPETRRAGASGGWGGAAHAVSSSVSASVRSATCAEDASRSPVRTGDPEYRMGVSGPKRGHANLVVTVAEAEVFDVLVRNEPAFNAPRCAITYRPRQEESDALREALVSSGSLSAQGEGADKIVSRVFLGEAYGDLIGRHERSVEMVIGFVFGTVLKNALKMVDVEFVCHRGVRRQLWVGGAVWPSGTEWSSFDTGALAMSWGVEQQETTGVVAGVEKDNCWRQCNAPQMLCRCLEQSPPVGLVRGRACAPTPASWRDQFVRWRVLQPVHGWS